MALASEPIKRALLAAATLLAVNPAILYIATGSGLISLVLPVAAVAGAQLLYRPRFSRLPLVYALNFIALAGIFVYAEAVFDARFSEYAPENLYSVEGGYYFNLPYLAERFVDKEYTAHYITNSQGLRVGEGQNVNEEVKSTDWLFIGDSFTQGAQVEFGELYTTQLYRRFPDKVIVNAGISGFGLPQEYRYFLDRGRQLKPSVVFLQLSSFNDLMNVRETEAGLTDHLVQRSDFLRFLLQDIKYENPPELPLGRWAEPFQPDEDGNRAYNVFYTADDDKKGQDLAAFVRYLSLFKRAVAENGAELVVVFIPTKEQTRQRYLDEVVREFGIDTAMLDMERPNRLLASVCDSLSIGLIDLLDPFRAAPQNPFYEFDEHLNAFGHDLMASTVAEALRSGTVLDEPLVSRAEALSLDFTSDRYPVQYPSGGLVSFQTVLDGNAEIIVTDSSFTDFHRLTVNEVDEVHPMLSPDLTRVVFTEGDAESMETEVVEMNLDGTERRVITSAPGLFGAIPTYGPSGMSVAYAAWEADGEGGYTLPRIVVEDLESGRQDIVTQQGEEAWRPVISSGGRIAYIKRVGTQFDLFLFDPELRREVRLTDTPHDEWDPSFSPNGNELVYAAQRGGDWDLMLLDLGALATPEGATAGAAPMPVPIPLTDTLGDEWDPSFSPDGRYILYAGHFGTMKGLYRFRLGDLQLDDADAVLDVAETGETR